MELDSPSIKYIANSLPLLRTAMLRQAGFAAASLLIALTAARAQEKPKPTTEVDRATLERKFAETMSGAVMVGSFTTTSGKGQGQAAKEEKYTLGKVEKLQNDYWLFNVRIQYGDKDATLPLPLEVQWAGDTPVITLTKQPIPGFGTFTARVLIYDDHYAGFWEGADHGGHLFGRITRPETEAARPGPPKSEQK
jgi:hypothetical protein